MVTEHSKTNLPSQHQFRYVIFLICILVGPSLAILQLKGFHITFGFLTMMGILYVVKMDSIDLKKVKLFINFVTFVSIWAVNHRLTVCYRLGMCFIYFILRLL